MITRYDIWLILIVIFIILLTYICRYVYLDKGEIIEITTQDKKYSERLTLSLKHPGKYYIHGKIGTTTVMIKDNRVCVISSPCPNKLCIKRGWVSRYGDIICCVPNKVVIKVKQKSNMAVDSVTW
jgi:hypothetical protein